MLAVVVACVGAEGEVVKPALYLELAHSQGALLTYINAFLLLAHDLDFPIMPPDKLNIFAPSDTFGTRGGGRFPLSAWFDGEALTRTHTIDTARQCFEEAPALRIEYTDFPPAKTFLVHLKPVVIPRTDTPPAYSKNFSSGVSFVDDLRTWLLSIAATDPRARCLRVEYLQSFAMWYAFTRPASYRASWRAHLTPLPCTAAALAAAAEAVGVAPGWEDAVYFFPRYCPQVKEKCGAQWEGGGGEWLCLPHTASVGAVAQALWAALGDLGYHRRENSSAATAAAGSKPVRLVVQLPLYLAPDVRDALAAGLGGVALPDPLPGAEECFGGMPPANGRAALAQLAAAASAVVMLEPTTHFLDYSVNVRAAAAPICTTETALTHWSGRNSVYVSCEPAGECPKYYGKCYANMHTMVPDMPASLSRRVVESPAGPPKKRKGKKKAKAREEAEAEKAKQEVTEEVKEEDDSPGEL